VHSKIQGQLLALNLETKTVIGGWRVNNFADCAGAVAARGAAYLALQQILGLLPERWLGTGGRDSTGAASGRAPVGAFARTIGISFPIRFWLQKLC
jgi:hypothetical protein